MHRSRPHTSTFLSIACLAGIFVGLVGCVETSFVVKVKEDGSGVLHLRSHQQKTQISLFAVPTKSDADDEKNSLPSPDKLDRMTKQLGTGIQLVSAESTKNRSGWKGYDLIWEFQDINQITLSNDLNDVLTESDDNHEADDQEKTSGKKPKKPQGLRFAMKDGMLEIRNFGFVQPATDDAKDDASERIGAVDPFADKPAGVSGTFPILNSATEEIAIKLLSDARVGLFIQVDGEIESTNAKHRQDNLITIMSLNVGELLKDLEAREQFKKLSGGSPPSRDQLQAIADANAGLDLDLQNPVRVQIR